MASWGYSTKATEVNVSPAYQERNRLSEMKSFKPIISIEPGGATDSVDWFERSVDFTFRKMQYNCARAQMPNFDVIQS